MDYSDLKPGDTAAWVCEDGRQRDALPATVKRVLKTKLVVDVEGTERHVRLSDGREYGDGPAAFGRYGWRLRIGPNAVRALQESQANDGKE
jgi:hypothetical protein